ncbi:MAG TPA: DNA cytosine methyltransferase [Bryobacteraceae bacterium]|jgi:DNA (cytosine-5)-methyltransferase 1|nr:DNA cytosine methyltransferase [Bryobacteraceae bacterium]
MKGNAEQPIGVDLFAGAGGLSLGFERAGFRVAAAVEYDPIHAATHEYNFPDCATICRSVADIDGDYIRTHSDIGKADIDVVFGGAPCQGFSMIGKRALDDPRNHLVYHFVRVVSELKPKYFIFENVRGLTLGEHKKFLGEIIVEFKAKGYKVEEDYQVLNALNFGVPQDRQRLFLMGARRGQHLPEYPSQTHGLPGANLDLGFTKTTPTVWDALGDLPEADDYEELLERDWVEADFAKPSPYAKLLRFGTGKTRNLLTSSLRTIHTALSQRRFKATAAGETEPVSRFLKLDPMGVCNTIRAGTASDRGAFTSPRPIHPFSPRCITVREAARLHSYPDWFRFHVTKWHGFRQVGNSVPPLLGQAVASKIMERVGRKVDSDEPRAVGDSVLLECNMSDAAARYGVAANVIPHRIRKEAGKANG